MKRIMSDALPLQLEPTRHRGIGQHTAQLLDALLRRTGDDQTHLFLVERDAPAPEPFPAGNTLPWRVVNGDYPLGTYRPEEWRTHLEPYAAHWEAALARADANVLHVHSPFELGAPPHVHPHSVPLVMTIHDLIPLRFPSHYLAGDRQWYAARYAHYLEVARTADRIVADSECTRADVISLLGIPPQRVVVALPGPSTVGAEPRDSARESILRKRYGLRAGFVLSTSGYDYRKNLPGTLKAYAQLDNALREAFPLVLVCGLDAAAERDVRQQAEALGISAQLVVTNYLPRADLASLYHVATVQFFPSLYEGFGFPVLDAMECGVPVVTSNVSSLPEIAGDAAVLADPADSSALAIALARVLESRDLQDRLRRAGLERAKRFSWSSAANVVAGVYRQC